MEKLVTDLITQALRHIAESHAELYSLYVEQVVANPGNLEALSSAYLLDLYDIHCDRCLPFVTNFADIDNIYLGLINKAQEQVLERATEMSGKWPEKFNRSRFLAVLRARILGRSHHWNAVAMKRVRDIEAAAKVPPPKPNPPGQVEARRGYRNEVRAWMKRSGIETVDSAAKTLAVSSSTLKSIMSDRGDLRYGKETLDNVLKKIGAKR